MKKDLEKTEIPEKLLIIVRGLPSSGKTTLAKLLFMAGSQTLSSDDYMTTPEGDYAFSKQNFIEAHKLCQQDCASLMENGEKIITLHNNMGEAWEAEVYFSLAEQHNYKVMVVNLYDAGLNDTELAARNVHEMPQHLVQKVRQKWDIDIYPHRKKKTVVQAPPVLKRFH